MKLKNIFKVIKNKLLYRQDKEIKRYNNFNKLL